VSKEEQAAIDAIPGLRDGLVEMWRLLTDDGRRPLDPRGGGEGIAYPQDIANRMLEQMEDRP